MTFAPEKYIRIKRKGVIEKQERCKDTSDYGYDQAVECNKKCFIEAFNVSIIIIFKSTLQSSSIR